VLNTLQGLFILVFFTCSKKVEMTIIHHPHSSLRRL
jgi:hypothetical protein